MSIFFIIINKILWDNWSINQTLWGFYDLSFALFQRKQSGSIGNWLSTYKKSTTILSKKEKSWPHKSTCSNLVKSLSFLSIVSISSGIIISMRLHSTTFQWTQLGVMILKRHIQRRKKLFISFFLRAHLINPLTCVYHFYAFSFHPPP